MTINNKTVLRKEVCSAFDRLQARFNPIVMEGAGSISEINLREVDLVNMPMAAHAGVISAAGVIENQFSLAEAFDYKIEYGDIMKLNID